jgi:hypothetical protein
LIEPFDEFLADGGLLTFCCIAVEDISGVVNLVVLYFFAVAPHSSFDEVHAHVLLSFVLDGEPYLFEAVQLVDEFEDGALLEYFVAEMVLDVGEHLKKLDVVDLGVPQDVPKRVGQSRLHFQERLQSQFVDLFETVAVEVRKVLDLKLTDQIFVGFRKEKLTQSAIGVNFKYFFLQFLFYQTFGLLFIDEVALAEVFDDGGFVLAFRGLDA